MPKLPEPDKKNRRGSLQSMALDVVLDSVLQFCEKLSDTGCVEKLRQGIAAIQEQLFNPNAIPDHLLADFCVRFFNKFYREDREAGHHNAALEIIMDFAVPGLRCEGLMTKYLDFGDEDRLHGLKILDLGFYPRTARLNVHNFHLQDLTTFIYPYNCTDDDLKVIGNNCKRLQNLEVPHSLKVSDEGLRALEPCLGIRRLDVARCRVSKHGIQDFLKVHKNIAHVNETLYSMYAAEYRSLRPRRFRRPSKYEEITTFVFENDVPCTNALLESLAESFPNLKKFVIDNASLGKVTKYYEFRDYRDEGDFSLLKSLSRLTEIDINLATFEDEDANDIREMIIDRSIDALHDLLSKSIGANITTLKYRHHCQSSSCRQVQLESICKWCPNMQCLGVNYESSMTIPSFQKLKELLLYCPDSCDLYTDGITVLDIKFQDKMLSLESLSAVDFIISLEIVKSMILDDVKFPKLTLMITNGIKDKDLAQIERIVYHNNLDFKIEHDPSSSTYNQLHHTVENAPEIIEYLDSDGSTYSNCRFVSDSSSDFEY